MPKYTSKSYYRGLNNRGATKVKKIKSKTSPRKKYEIIDEDKFIKEWVEWNIHHYYEDKGNRWENKEEFMGYGRDSYQMAISEIVTIEIPEQYRKFLNPEDDPSDFIIIYKGFFERPNKIDFSKLSVHWTFDLYEAESSDWSGDDGSIVVALVHKKDIDWMQTLLRNTDVGGYTENEITLDLMKTLNESSLIPVAILDKKLDLKEVKAIQLPKKALITETWIE
jgi:hypothetical protein